MERRVASRRDGDAHAGVERVLNFQSCLGYSLLYLTPYLPTTLVTIHHPTRGSRFTRLNKLLSGLR